MHKKHLRKHWARKRKKNICRETDNNTCNKRAASMTIKKAVELVYHHYRNIYVPVAEWFANAGTATSISQTCSSMPSYGKMMQPLRTSLETLYQPRQQWSLVNKNNAVFHLFHTKNFENRCNIAKIGRAFHGIWRKYVHCSLLLQYIGYKDNAQCKSPLIMLASSCSPRANLHSNFLFLSPFPFFCKTITWWWWSVRRA